MDLHRCNSSSYALSNAAFILLARFEACGGGMSVDGRRMVLLVGCGCVIEAAYYNVDVPIGVSSLSYPCCIKGVKNVKSSWSNQPAVSKGFLFWCQAFSMRSLCLASRCFRAASLPGAASRRCGIAPDVRGGGVYASARAEPVQNLLRCDSSSWAR